MQLLPIISYMTLSVPKSSIFLMILIINCLFMSNVWFKNFNIKVDGNMFMLYNMGTDDHPIGEVLSHVNDGEYHVVKFVRSGPNATLQVDDYDIQNKHPKGLYFM